MFWCARCVQLYLRADGDRLSSSFVAYICGYLIPASLRARETSSDCQTVTVGGKGAGAVMNRGVRNSVSTVPAPAAARLHFIPPHIPALTQRCSRGCADDKGVVVLVWKDRQGQTGTDA